MSNGWGDLLGFASNLFGGGADVLPEEGVPLAGPPGVSAPLAVPTAETPTPSAFSQFASKLGGGVAKEFTDSPLSAFSKTLGLGATALSIPNALNTQKQLAEQTQMLKKGQKSAQAAAAPAVQAGTEQLAESRAGKLPAPMEAAVEQWKQQAKADMRARFASMGLGNSSDIQHEESRIDLMGESMKAQLLQGQEGLALEALQTGVSAGTGTAQVASQQQNTLAALIQAANQQLGRLGSAQA